MHPSFLDRSTSLETDNERAAVTCLLSTATLTATASAQCARPLPMPRRLQSEASCPDRTLFYPSLLQKHRDAAECRLLQTEVFTFASKPQTLVFLLDRPKSPFGGTRSSCHPSLRMYKSSTQTLIGRLPDVPHCCPFQQAHQRSPCFVGSSKFQATHSRENHTRLPRPLSESPPTHRHYRSFLTASTHPSAEPALSVFLPFACRHRARETQTGRLPDKAPLLSLPSIKAKVSLFDRECQFQARHSPQNCSCLPLSRS